MPVPTAPPSSPDAAARPGGLGTLGVASLILLWTLAFKPDPWWWAVIPGFVGSLWLCERVVSTGSFLRWSLLFGALGIGYGYRWLAPTMQLFGGVPAPVAVLLTAVFGVIGIAHGWVFAAFYRSMLARGARPSPLTVAALWVACESLVPRLFPWMAGHGMVDVAPVRMAAEWGGVPGASFVTLALVAPLHEALRWAWPLPGRPPARPVAALVCFGVGVALLVHGLVRYGQVREAERRAPERLAVALVQPNVGSLDKRAAENREAPARRLSAEAYREGSEKAARAGAELIIWPETAVTESIGYTSDPAAVTNQRLKATGHDVLNRLGLDHDFLIGAYERREVKPGLRDDGKVPDERWNTAALRARGGLNASWTTFRKVYLIPFGEAMPFGLMEDRLPQRFRMVPGEPPQPLLSLGRGRRALKLLPFLCYEGILPDYVRACADEERPGLLVSLANDSWFGDSWEPWQHLAFTRFRAVEHGVPLVRATNTGVSAFVSSAGDVEARLAVGVDDVLVRDVPLRAEERRTIYVRYGHLLPWALAAWALLAWLGSRGGPPAVTAERREPRPR